MINRLQLMELLYSVLAGAGLGEAARCFWRARRGSADAVQAAFARAESVPGLPRDVTTALRLGHHLLRNPADEASITALYEISIRVNGLR